MSTEIRPPLEDGDNGVPGEGGASNPVPEEEELFAGTKIDSADEALASEDALAEAFGPLSEPAESDAGGALYTLGIWRIKDDRGMEEFIAAWQVLNELFHQLPQPPAGKGVLVQDISDPALFYSFGPWQDLTDIEAMRQDTQVLAALETLRQHCSEARTGVYRTVAEAKIN
jgi:hypothetical protein